MRKFTSLLFAGLLVILLSTTAWAGIDPRNNFGGCGFTSTEEYFEPAEGGQLMQRVIYDSQCDTPSAGEETITITTEEWNGVSMEVTEVRTGVRTEVGGIYYTTLEIYVGGLLEGKEEHTYDHPGYPTEPGDIWYQEWVDYDWNGSGFDVSGYLTRITEWFTNDEQEATYVWYDRTDRADPVIPDDVPVLGSSSASAPILPPLDKHVDSLAYLNLGRMYERVRNVLLVNPNTQREADVFLRGANGEPVSHLCSPPPGFFVAAVLKGDRWNDPQDIIFNGYFHRWIKWLNTVTGDLEVQYGWTSDRDLNPSTSDWWQAAVRQSPTGAIEAIENAHRSGPSEGDHYDTFTLLNSMFMIESQTVKTFDLDGTVFPGDFTQTTVVTDGMAQPVSYTMWTVDYD